MITREEVEYACDLIEASDGPTPALATIRAYVAQEPARDAAEAWAEAHMERRRAYREAVSMYSDTADAAEYFAAKRKAKKARRAYLALRAARPTETEGGK